MIAVFFTLVTALVVTLSYIAQRRLKKIVKSLTLERDVAVERYFELKRDHEEKIRVFCDLKISPWELKNNPDDFIDFEAEEACRALVKEMAKTFESTVKEKVKEQLARIKSEELFTAPYFELINVSVPVFKIDTDDVKVAIRDFKKKRTGERQ